MIRTRKKSVGREPSLRDAILELLSDADRSMTAREIAEILDVNKTTPFRPLADLVEMELVLRHENGLDGTEYSANKEKINTMVNLPRRFKDIVKVV